MQAKKIGIILFLLFVVSGCTQKETTETKKIQQENRKNFIESNTTETEKIVETNGVKHLASINLNDIVLGCPGKDCIKSIDNPKFESVSSASTYLKDNDRILALKYEGIVKGYPSKILDRHEIVNDFFGEKPVLVSYCPLCGTGIAFKRQVNGETVEFGVSGRLYNSNLIMYDRKTSSFWQQITGKAIVGELTGKKLEQIPMDTMQWKDFKKRFPEANVLKGVYPTTIYESYPYGDYEESNEVFFPVKNKNNKYKAKEWVYGLEINGKTKVWPEKEVNKANIINDELAGKKILIVKNPETNTIKFFERTINNKTLEFTIVNGKLKTKDESSEWGFEGNALSGKLKGKKLKQIPVIRSFWFSWVALHPNTLTFES